MPIANCELGEGKMARTKESALANALAFPKSPPPKEVPPWRQGGIVWKNGRYFVMVSGSWK